MRVKAKYQIVFWRDIPAQVKVRVGRKRSGQLLTPRFQVAIDEAAMQVGLTSSDAYLQEWRTTAWQEAEGTPDKVLATLVAELESNYSSDHLRRLIKNGGWVEEK